jgi:carboxypeptidase Taq
MALFNSDARYEDYRNHLRKTADIKNALAVLQWDQETYLPPAGAEFRGQQIATLSEIAHEHSSSEDFGNIIRDLLERGDLPFREKKNILLSWEDYSRQKKYTASFVRLLSETVSRSFHSWMQARKENSFSIFEKDLDSLIELKKQEADMLGFDAHPYDALLDEYEKGCTVQLLDNTFKHLHPSIKNLLDTVSDRKQVNDEFLYKKYPREAQWEFGLGIIKQLGFDFDAGRQDISEHPFSTSFNARDVRITTRIDEHDFGNMTWSCIHETGHALYEQGLPIEEYGLPSGEYTSLSIHESQSRLWENNIGRSLIFWKKQYAGLKKTFSSQLDDIGLEEFYRGINRVEPSLIRTEADELTYHFHVMIRYELEKALIEGQLRSKDIPSYWNQQYEKYLGIRVPDDKQGCLQDIHWSHGSFGYFPTYSLGSLYAAQFFSAAMEQVPELSTEIENGNYRPLLNWLRQRIHQRGRTLNSEELCKEATGKVLDVQHFLRYALDKYSKIYDF